MKTVNKIESVRKLTCVTTVVASLLLASAAAALADTPVYKYKALTNANASGPIAIATTVPTPRSAYVVAAGLISGSALEVTAWHDTTSSLEPVETPGVMAGIVPVSVAVTGLDSSRVVTADFDNNGTLSINTWTIGSTAVTWQNGAGTPNATDDDSVVSIVALSSTEVVTAFADSNDTLVVEAWTISADGYPTAEGPIGYGPQSVAQVSIAAVNSNQVVTAVVDSYNTLWVTTWGVDSTGVSSPYQDQVPWTTSPVSRFSQHISIGAGTKLVYNGYFHFPQFEFVQSAFTPIITGPGNVEVLDWGISSTGKLSLQNKPISTPSDDYFHVAACMLPRNVPITAYADVDLNVNLGPYGNGGAPAAYNASIDGTNYITSIAAAAAGTDYNVFALGSYNAYFVTGVLSYVNSPEVSAPVGTLEIREWSYPERPLFF
ncbi:MAG: hypothetical protein ABSH13_04380 [Candidatus Acidiferrum sp.]